MVENNLNVEVPTQINEVPQVTPIINSELVTPIETAEVITAPTQGLAGGFMISDGSHELEKAFTGDAISKKVAEINILRMSSNIAVILDVKFMESKQNNPMVRITFGDAKFPGDTTKGHTEYLSCTDGYRYQSTIGKLGWLVKHLADDDLKESFNNSQSLTFRIVKDSVGQPVKFTEWTELDKLKLLTQNDSLTAIFGEKNNYVNKTAVVFPNPVGLLQAIASSLQSAVNRKILLQVDFDDKGFQRIKKFLPVTA